MNPKTPGDPGPPGRFELVRTLGSGGGGRVRLVRDLRQGGAPRALKVARSEDADPEDAARLFHEARVLRSLRHPGIPRVFDVGRTPGRPPWLLMEYVAPVDEPPAPVDLALGLLDILAYVHEFGWLHRDLKPGNVLNGPGGRVVLADFGLAARMDEDVPPRGTLPYVSPEVLDGESADATSDLWSLGAVLLRLSLEEELQPSQSLTPEHVPDDGSVPAEWLRRMLHPRRERRFPSARAARTALLEALGRPASPLRRWPLPHSPVPVGRASELEGLLRRLREARRGVTPDADRRADRDSPGMALLSGGPGVGKSRLLAELRMRALEGGWSVFLASCADERDAPLPALGSVLEAVLREAPPDSAAVKRRGRAVASLLAARSDRDPSETAARFLEERAREGAGMLILVEDLQQASAMTLRVLSGIARVVAAGRVAGEPVPLFVVATLVRSGSLPEEVAEMLGKLETERVLWRVPLRLLAPQDLVSLVHGILGPHAPGERIGEILRAHGGAHPLFAEELLARLVAEGGLRNDSGRWLLDERRAPKLPENLAQLVQVRLDSLLEEELRAVQLLATLERPLRLQHARALLGADAEAILGTLESMGLVAPAQEGRAAALAHGVLGQAALSVLTAPSRRRLHDRVAANLPWREIGTPVRRAYHVARGSDTDKGFQIATAVARRLRGEGEPGRAADFVRQALRLLPDGDPRIPHLRRSLAELLVASGRPEAAANVYRDLLEESPGPDLRARLLAGLAEALDSSGQSAEVMDTCREALAALH